jgi:hypothetical protein
MLLVLSREMRIGQRHLSVFMIHQLFHRRQINPRYDQAVGKGMPQIMKRKILDIRPPDSPLKDRPKGPVGHALAVAKNLRRSRSVYSNDLESLRQDFIHWHTAALPIFRVCSSHSNDALLKIYVTPRQGEEFRGSKSRMQGSLSPEV